eukprot:355619-Chlamydomonas_euryale.AAC.1
MHAGRCIYQYLNVSLAERSLRRNHQGGIIEEGLLSRRERKDCSIALNMRHSKDIAGTLRDCFLNIYIRACSGWLGVGGLAQRWARRRVGLQFGGVAVDGLGRVGSQFGGVAVDGLGSVDSRNGGLAGAWARSSVGLRWVAFGSVGRFGGLVVRWARGAMACTSMAFGCMACRWMACGRMACTTMAC